jgi:8-amino-7-oxononanoate synthase
MRRGPKNRFHVKQSTPYALRHLVDALRDLERRDLLRTRPDPVADVALSFCSNDYLGLAGRVAVDAPSGAGASRLVVGERAEHRELEADLAAWLRVQSVLTFTSGYAANLGTVSALAGPEDLIVSDVLNHASIIDGARLSRAEVAVVPHLDLAAVETALGRSRGRRAWVITESYFSMDGDTPDLPALRRICDAAGAALVVDEAHALGLFGPDGRGLCAEAGVVPDVMLGTFGKSFGAGGAFAAGCEALIAWLWNRARSFVFSTGLSPVVAAAARDGLARAVSDASLRADVLARASELRSGLGNGGLDVRGHGPIIPLILGDPARAVRLARVLRERGVHVQAIRPPSVPEGTARLRLTVTARHTAADVAYAVAAITESLACLPSS